MAESGASAKRAMMAYSLFKEAICNMKGESNRKLGILEKKYNMSLAQMEFMARCGGGIEPFLKEVDYINREMERQYRK